MKRYLHLSLLFVQLCMPAFAKEVTLKLASGLTANANFEAGKENKTAIMIIHGFQSTYNYGTIQGMSSELTSQGYSVLTPNLTLGVDNRREPLACQHPHTNTIEQEGEEIADWSKWLQKQGYRNLIIIGHSAGSTSILASLDYQQQNKPQKIILTALYDFDNWPNNDLTRDKQIAQDNANTGKFANYYMGLCNGNFVANSASYLSYRAWNKQQLIDRINHSKLPITIIMPGADPRLHGKNKDWLDTIQKSRATLMIVKHADHFFSSDAEFDLNEAIAKILKTQ